MDWMGAQKHKLLFFGHLNYIITLKVVPFWQKHMPQLKTLQYPFQQYITLASGRISFGDTPD